MDSEKRELYDKLGPEAAASKVPMSENSVLLEVITPLCPVAFVAPFASMLGFHFASSGWVHVLLSVMLYHSVLQPRDSNGMLGSLTCMCYGAVQLRDTG